MARIKALINGQWYGDLEETPAVRRALATGDRFRTRVTADGGPGPNGASALPAEPGRYHLYVSYACPWAHRTILYRRLKGLEDVISLSVLHPRMGDEAGWRFGDTAMSTPDHANGCRYLHEVYQRGKPDATTRVTVPMLWDKHEGRIVNRESGDIMRMLNSAFDRWGDADVDFYPPGLRPAIDKLNALILPRVCAGVYRAGFARSQADYDRAVHELFETLDELERRLGRQPYLLGEHITESDWHLFCTLVRFDAAYHGALRCNRYRLTDYPALAAFTRRLYRLPGVAETVKFDHIKAHYYDDLGELEPTIVPAGPARDFRSECTAKPPPEFSRIEAEH
ncbi:glutathione S-transferase family protein [Arhodomonas sp. AD133]|uniref:glutathione S-transferase family protein n=1 Tax=Arhodomonas sp. AD133 TaxID=3415009 RepID=UPI003EBA9368